MKTFKMNFILRLVKILFLIFLFIFSFSCNENGLAPGLGERINLRFAGRGTEISYFKQINYKWKVCLNNLSGTNIKIISNDIVTEDDYSWSPNGKYISYTRNSKIYLYDVENSTSKYISSDSLFESAPKWIPNGTKIFYQCKNRYGQTWISIMNPDGTDKQKILDMEAKIFFLNDNFSFIYKPTSISENKIYLSDLKRTTDEIISLPIINGKYKPSLYDFNPITNELLLLVNSGPNDSNFVATFNLINKNINIVSVADPGWNYARPKYSNDHLKIVFVSINYDEHIYKIILLDKNEKKDLIEITQQAEWIDFNPMAFSPHDKYLAYSKNIYQPGIWVSWKSYLYIIDVNSKSNYYVDEGERPMWNPAFNY